MRTIGVVTVGRSDYGLYLPLLKEIAADPDLRLWVFAGGMHLEPAFGLTVKMIEADGFEVRERVDMRLSSDTPEGIAESLGLGIKGFASCFARSRPDMLVVLGDRFDMFAAAAAALPFKIPVAHIHGGEITRGAMDDALRHAMTKLSHIHFVATQGYARRVIQMGEESWRVTVCGALSLDNIRLLQRMSADELCKQFGLDLSTSPLLVTFHPVTLEYESTEQHIRELLLALEEVGLPVVFTMPNADTSNRVISEQIAGFVRTHKRARLVENFGTRGYLSMMAHAAAMVGNSSSGMVEAALFKLPVVNIGTRQDGRLRTRNILDVPCARRAIVEGIRRAVDPGFRASLESLQSPFGDGHAASCIVDCLKKVSLGADLLIKRFADVL